MSIVRSVCMCTAVGFIVAVALETAEGPQGAVDRVLNRTYDKVKITAMSTVDELREHLPANLAQIEALRVAGR